MSISGFAVILCLARVQNKNQEAFSIVTDAQFEHVQRKHPRAVTSWNILRNAVDSGVGHDSARRAGSSKLLRSCHDGAEKRFYPQLGLLHVSPSRSSARPTNTNWADSI